MSQDHYAILGVAPDASTKEISKAFRTKARKLHPDKQPQGATEAQKLQAKQAFQALSLANEILSDENKRRTYDLSRHHGGGSADAPEEEPPNEWDDEDSEFFAGRPRPRPKKKVRAKNSQEHDQENAHKNDDAYADLGSHWIGGKVPQQQTGKWKGWSSAGIPPASQHAQDADSDASSELSFDIHVFDVGLKLHQLDLTMPVYAKDEHEELGMGGGEFLKIRKPDATAKTEEPAAAKRAKDSKKASKQGKDEAAAQPRCCAVQ